MTFDQYKTALDMWHAYRVVADGENKRDAGKLWNKFNNYVEGLGISAGQRDKLIQSYAYCVVTKS